MPLTVQELHSEVVLEGTPGVRPARGERALSLRKEELRAVVRQILQEERERAWRTDPRRP